MGALDLLTGIGFSRIISDVRVAWLFAFVGIAAGLPAQEVPVWRVAELEAKYDEPFDKLRGARELRDGRLLLLDFGFFIVNVSKGVRAPLARSGDGPGEYRAPFLILPLSGDTSAYLDLARPYKLLFILPSGELRGSIDIDIGGNVRYPEAADGRGRLYAIHRRSKGRGVIKDSTDIVRLDPSNRRIDTVAALLERKVVSSVKPKFGPAPPPPFYTHEVWAVSSDAVVVAVSVVPYRVTFFNPDRTVTTGPILPAENLKVTKAHREAWIDQAMEPHLRLGRYNFGPLTAEFVRPRKSEVEPNDWPSVLPPFLPKAASFAPDGMLWIQRTTPDPSIGSIDVIDRKGQLIGRLTLPSNRRLLCHGSSGVYLVRVDEDGLQYIERYRLPSGYREAAER